MWELLEPKSESMQQTDWVDFSLPGFNLHLNFHDIRNYDKNDITNQLKSALLVEEKQNNDVDGFGDPFFNSAIF